MMNLTRKDLIFLQAKAKSNLLKAQKILDDPQKFADLLEWLRLHNSIRYRKLISGRNFTLHFIAMCNLDRGKH